MPIRDGTGPFGVGPGTGRRKGFCRSGYPGRTGIFYGTRFFWGVVAPAAVVLLRDLLNPKGFLWQILTGAISSAKSARPGEIKKVKYSVIEEPPERKNK